VRSVQTDSGVATPVEWSRHCRNGADPTDVQRALRHSRLRTTLETYVQTLETYVQTLETYVHWWPKKTRRRNVVGTTLRDAAASRDMARK
jgi:hypothetical protein